MLLLALKNWCLYFFSISQGLSIVNYIKNTESIMIFMR